MSIDVGAIVTAMVAAGKASLKTSWPKVREYVSAESQKMATTFAQIEALTLAGKINQAEASVLFEMQKNASRAVLLSVKGMGLIAVEMAINAAIDAVRGSVNGALGFALL